MFSKNCFSLQKLKLKEITKALTPYKKATKAFNLSSVWFAELNESI